MSGRSGPFVYYRLNRKQCWRRYCVPEDPHTAHQQRSRAAFRAASRTWSLHGPLTDQQREAWYADGAKRQSRTRLGQSGPLTGQQNYIGQNSTRKQRDYQMLSHPHQREQEQTKHKRLKSELTVQVSRSQPVTRPTSGRPQTSTRLLPVQHQPKASQPQGTGKRGSLKRPPRLAKARGNARRLRQSSVLIEARTG